MFHADSLLQSMTEFMSDYILIGFRIVLPIFWCDIASECNPGSAGQGISPDEYVCSRYSAEGSGGTDGDVALPPGCFRGCRFCLSGNEKDGSIFYRRYDVILEYDLQFFAAEGQGGEKTEPATEKKLSDARKEGQVAKSREIANGLGLLTVFLVLKIWVGHIGVSVYKCVQRHLRENSRGGDFLAR
mgnify:CR=1 FL=1